LQIILLLECASRVNTGPTLVIIFCGRDVSLQRN